MNNLVEEIAAKAASLPLEQQREALAFVEALTQRAAQTNPALPTSPRSFQSIEGIIPRRIERLDEDLAEVRREMWRNFPREEKLTAVREAMNDPLFLADLHETADDFNFADVALMGNG